MSTKDSYEGIEQAYRCKDIYMLEVLTGKWRLPIIWTLSTKESMRYNELKRELISITNIMLTRSLQGLEAFGLVERTEYDEVPPRVEYSLTPKCRELLPALEIINEWGRDLLHTHHGAKTLSDLEKNQREAAQTETPNMDAAVTP